MPCGVLLIVTGILFKHGMEIGSTEAEGADPCSTGNICPSCDPRASLSVYVERGGREVRSRVGLLDVDGGGQHLIVQCQGDFDHASDASGTLGMPDHRLHGSDPTVLAGRSGC